MADPVNVTTDDLLREVAMLSMECKLRAKREDALLARIAELEKPQVTETKRK